MVLQTMTDEHQGWQFGRPLQEPIHQMQSWRELYPRRLGHGGLDHDGDLHDVLDACQSIVISDGSIR